MTKPVSHHLRALAAISLVTLACHLPALRAPFIWDDHQIHVHNPHMGPSESLLRYFSIDHWQRSHAFSASPYRPLREILLGVMKRAFGADPVPFHAVNLAGHVVNAMLVYVAAVLLLGRSVPALAAALVFALHPSHVEVVAWAKNVGEVASVFFALLALIGWVRWVNRSEARGRAEGWAWGALSTGCFAASLLCKESAVALPLVLTAWALLLGKGRARRRALVRSIPLWVVMLAYLVLQSLLRQLTRADAFGTPVPSGLCLRVMLVFRTVLKYIQMLAFPIGHSPWHALPVTGHETLWEYGGVCLAIAGLGVAWLWAVRRRPVVGLAMFWVVAGIGPASNIVVNTGRPIAEQRLYFPSAGFAVLAGALVTLLSADRRRSVQWLMLALCVVYGALQFHGLGTWQGERSLWVRGGRHSPRQIFAARMRQGLNWGALGRDERALNSFAHAARIRPNDPRGYLNAGLACCRLGRFDQGLAALRRAQSLAPGDPWITCDIAQALEDSGDHEQALAEWQRAVTGLRVLARRDPENPGILGLWARAAGALGLKDEARAAQARAHGLGQRKP